MIQRITATFRSGQLELTQQVDWPEGTQVEVRPLQANQMDNASAGLKAWPAGFFEQLHAQWGNQPFDRPEQGEFEQREKW